ncbi:hypothetical protein HOY80DRAFT_950529, partial [Tuber brumale]
TLVKLSNPPQPGVPVASPTFLSKRIPALQLPLHNPRKMPLFPSGPTGDTNRTDYCSFLQRYECRGYLQRVMDEPFKKKK